MMSFSQRSFQIIINLLLLLLVIASAFYWLNNTLQHRHQEIGEWLSETVGYPVEVKRSRLTWSVLSPQLLLEDVKILEQDHSDDLLSLERITLDFDLLASLWHRDINLDDIALTGLKLTVIRNGSGQLSLRGVETKGDSMPVFASFLVSAGIMDSVRLTDITLNYIDQQQSFLSGRYRLNQGLIKHRAERWNAEALIMLPPALGNKVGVMASWSEKEDSEWSWHIDGDDLISDNLAAYLQWQGVSLTQAHIDVNMQGKGHSAILNELVIDMDINDANLSSLSPAISKQVKLQHLSGGLKATRQSEGWLLEGNNIDVSIDDNKWPLTSFILKQQNDILNVSGGFFSISDLTSIAALSEQVAEDIDKLKPAGDAMQFEFDYSQVKGLNSVQLALREAAMLPWQGYPGITGLSADIDWKPGKVTTVLNSKNVTLHPQNGFKEALFFDVISGEFEFIQSGEQWQLDNKALRVWNEDLSIELTGSVNHGLDGSINNDLLIELGDIKVNQWQKYIPRDLLHGGFKAWSDKAFVDGKITQGQIVLKGDLAAFPYQRPEDKLLGSFDMQLQVEDIQLHYASEWPDIVNVNGTVTGNGDDLIIKSRQGTIADFAFLDVETRIDKLTKPNPILTLKGQLKGTTAQAVQFLKTSPLKARFGKVANLITAQGGSNINLQLKVPLSHADETEVKGDVSFINSTLFKTSLPELAISKINGKIDFSHQSVSAQSITAQAFENPIKVDVGPKNNKTVISANGHISDEQLGLLASRDLSRYIQGKIEYQLAVEITEKEVGEFYADVIVDSNLRGLNVFLPAPLYKTADQTVDFQTVLDQSVSSSRYKVDYDGKASLSMLVSDNANRQFEVNLNTLDLEAWLDLQEENKNSFFQLNDEIVFTTQQATVFDQQLTNIELVSKKQSDGWSGRLNSQQTNGSFFVANDSYDDYGLVKADLDNLRLHFEDNKQPKQQKLSREIASLWPAIELNIGSLIINQASLGKLSLKSKRTATQWSIESASLQSQSFEANVLEGTWQQVGTIQNTQFHIKANSNDLASTLASFDYQQVIDAQNSQADVVISWPSDPLSFSKKNIQGKLLFEIGKGELEEVKPGAAGRVFGLLSFAAIPRRLALDFNDLFGKGFDFTSIKGSFDIANGIATTKDLVLNSESAKIEISGPIDLVNQRYDQVVKVIPNVSSTLPLAGAVAGGPVGLGVGTAILLVDKLAGRLFDKQIVNLISYSYKLKGSWLNPELNILTPAQP